MPFTLAHPVAILPIARKWPRLPFSALVFGSMAPDFPYFLFINNDYYHIGHTRLGLFTFCLPAGLLAMWVFHTIVKLPLLSLLPPAQVEKLYPVAKHYRLRSLTDFTLTAGALIVGALSHIVVDSFTHRNGIGVQHLPFLYSPWPLYKVLQYGGSVLGLWYLYWLYRQWFRHAPADAEAARSLQRLLLPGQVTAMLIVLLLVASCAGIGYTSFIFMHTIGPENAKKIFADALECAMSVCAMGIIAFSVIWHVVKARRATGN